MQVKVYLANLKLNRIYHFEKQKIIANDYLTQTTLPYDFTFSFLTSIIQKVSIRIVQMSEMADFFIDSLFCQKGA